VIEIETVRETSGKAEVIHTEIAAFSTPTGNDNINAAPQVWYSHGTLHIRNLDDYLCRLTP
ncbi:MAG: hypothetical protein LBD53_11730, partial [Tannerella sp.]|jgi:hypothetical protein|nr:hypothetical protein [Tannerella sp.]